MDKLKTKGSNSIKSKIQNSMIIIVAVSLIIVGSVTSILNYTSTIDTVRQNMTATAKIAAERISEEISKYKMLAQETGCNSRLGNAYISVNEKLSIAKAKAEKYNMAECLVINAEGMNLSSGVDSSDMEYYKQAMAGNIYVSEPAIIDTTGKMSMVISAPIWKDGVENTKIVGVVMYIPQHDFLNNIVADISVSENSASYIIDHNGYTIADVSMEVVESKENIEEIAKTDSTYKTVAKLHEKMRAGESGFSDHKLGKSYEFMSYAPIADTNGWSVAVFSAQKDFTQSTSMGVGITALIIIASILFAIAASKKIGNGIGRPIEACVERLVLLSEGDLNTEVPHFDTKDETKQLIDATEKIVSYLKTVILDADYLLGEMAEGNFNVRTKHGEAYVGDFEGLLLSMRKMNINLDKSLRNVYEASNQVSAGSAQMSESAQSLAEGATEQAGAVEELTATISNIADLINLSAQKSKQSYEQTISISDVAKSSQREMNDMVAAMERISAASEEIEKIIGQIEDIATQTNLLSLNAAIEAARAGEAGKGFAVVADQIRKLAEESANSAVQTRELIGTSLKEVENGNAITGRTSKSLDGVIKGVEEFANTSKEIADMSNNQADAIQQIEQGIEQISVVVQTNAATSQETSATSEELSAQAVTLDNIIGSFTLREN